uniref:Uncharacterized protein n=1 Tax=Octopus bimaculoides TaxID=37653 RepID=A0A0L8G8Z5_OCTBM
MLHFHRMRIYFRHGFYPGFKMDGLLQFAEGNCLPATTTTIELLRILISTSTTNYFFLYRCVI